MFRRKFSPEEYRRRRPRCEYCMYSRPFPMVSPTQLSSFPYTWCKLRNKAVRMHIPRKFCPGFCADYEVGKD